MGNQYMIRIHKDQSCNNISTANRARALSLSLIGTCCTGIARIFFF